MSANLSDKAKITLQKNFSYMLIYPITHLSANNKVNIELDEKQLDFLIRQKKKLVELLSTDIANTAEYMSKMLIEQLLSKNQFLTIEQDDRLELIEIYKRELGDFLDILRNFDNHESIIEYLKKHFTYIAKFIINLYRQDKESTEFAISEAICSQYSATTQMHILRIDDPKKLVQPILDVGCGKDAYLVKYLLRHDIEAYGIDRHVTIGQNLITTDWFDYDFKPNFWGTIISQMAFSIHFFHHHLRKDGNPSKFARLYMKLLSSLKNGGSFIYAPGLPFIEQYLPLDQFAVEKKDIHLNEIKEIKEQIQAKKQIVDEILYSAHIYKK
ncbi:TPA: class I SAM-dependent methyltransferase [bacterium]|nr:class I SAM-dependent methyltransferase [bacterium]